MSRRVIPAMTLLVLVLLAGALIILGGHQTRTVSAEFDRTVGLFEGSDVRVMGMRIGEVTRITPHGTAVRVDMSYDAKYRLPKDVKAVVIAPSVIADRFVQLTPGYVDGPVLASGAVIPEQRTRVPVELDRSLEVTQDLVTALGPDGANKNGALSGALGTVAHLLDGNGAATRNALQALADASGTIARGSGNLSGTVTHLASVSGTLATYDDDVQRFNTELSSVTGSLAADSDQLSALLASLARSLGEVSTFVAQNRSALVTDVGRLSSVTQALVNERQALTEILTIAPLAFTDLTETYDPQAQAVRTRANFSEIARILDQVVCDALVKQAGSKVQPLCTALHQFLDTTPLRSGLDSLPTPPAAPTAPATSGRTSLFSGPLASLTSMGGLL
ncbi:MCE family protein [Nocardioides marmorisolisilvae]|uniref:MCE family protein n=1 Tax=Nocardioides marmorisolisilvae TaxID=1542737 RepID=A0A3N0DSD2_9ACTN|nr:MCE family protein [Nocardioides marmorisolisilvae]RNL78396.1 MCE family protein [Nocardioides marmorisolisilvae]